MSKILDASGNPYQPRAVRNSRSSGKANPNPVIARIAQQFKDRSRKDISKWRSALQLAEDKDEPRRERPDQIHNENKRNKGGDAVADRREHVLAQPCNKTNFTGWR